MKYTKIEWADHTFNPWIGCTQISPACDHCYAQVHQDRRFGRVKWGAGQPRSRTSPTNWKKPLTWNRQAAAEGTRPFVFCASLADVFDNEVDPAWRADLFELIERTPQLVWLLLTKRIGNVLKMVKALPPNVALGATMANQAEYDRDAPKLQMAASRLDPLFTFGSFEPLLGPVELDTFNAPDWIIVGGESGRGARPMDLEWARNLREQSRDLRRVFNFKQTGAQIGHGSDLLDGQQHFERPCVKECEHRRGDNGSDGDMIAELDDKLVDHLPDENSIELRFSKELFDARLRAINTEKADQTNGKEI